MQTSNVHTTTGRSIQQRSSNDNVCKKTTSEPTSSSFQQTSHHDVRECVGRRLRQLVVLAAVLLPEHHAHFQDALCLQVCSMTSKQKMITSKQNTIKQLFNHKQAKYYKTILAFPFPVQPLRSSSSMPASPGPGLVV